jgi:hypothetical protein
MKGRRKCKRRVRKMIVNRKKTLAILPNSQLTSHARPFPTTNRNNPKKNLQRRNLQEA